MKAKAVVFTAKNTVSVESVTCETPTENDVIVRTTKSWISNGTEGSYLRGERSDGDRPFEDGDKLPFPVVAGYQKIGVVEWVGKNITDLEIGETVFCTIGRVKGMHHWYAGQLSHSVCSRNDVWKLPKKVEPLAFAGMVLTQVGYNAGIRPKIEFGDIAVVIGDGLVGHWTAQTLAWRGATVVLVGRHDQRLEMFCTKPFRHTINAKQENWVEIIVATYGKNIKVAVDTVGDMQVMEDFQQIVKRFGHVVSAGFYGKADRLSLQPPRYGEYSIDLVSGWTRNRMDETLRLIAGDYLETLSLITHTFPVDDASKAWELIESKRKPVLGVILEW